MFLDDLLTKRALSYANLPANIFINDTLVVAMEDMEARVNQNNPHGSEGGSLIGFHSNEMRLCSLDFVIQEEGGTFDPRVFLKGDAHDFGKVALGFSYRGTFHTHPRSTDDDQLRSFSAMDVVSVAKGTFQEQVSLMITGKSMHMLVRCDEIQDVPAREYVRNMVVKSLEDATADQEGEMEIDGPQIVDLAKGPQSIAAVMNAAKQLHLGYYLGNIGDRLLSLR